VYSEDPHLTGQLGAAWITGAQRDKADNGSPYLLAAAGAKHWAGYDVETIPANRYGWNANLTKRDFWEFCECYNYN
jgi:beta-glucosidase-like glycosyl hydrolase